MSYGPLVVTHKIFYPIPQHPGGDHMTDIIDIDKRVSQYVKLRDEIKKLDDEHAEKLKPYREALETLNGVLLGHLNNIGADRAAAPAGTVYKTVKKSATLADKAAFWTYVVAMGNFDLIDYKANPVEVAKHIADNDGEAPPGVNYTETALVGVRRATRS